MQLKAVLLKVNYGSYLYRSSVYNLSPIHWPQLHVRVSVYPLHKESFKITSPVMNQNKVIWHVQFGFLKMKSYQVLSQTCSYQSWRERRRKEVLMLFTIIIYFNKILQTKLWSNFFKKYYIIVKLQPRGVASFLTCCSLFPKGICLRGYSALQIFFYSTLPLNMYCFFLFPVNCLHVSSSNRKVMYLNLKLLIQVPTMKRVFPQWYMLFISYEG